MQWEGVEEAVLEKQMPGNSEGNRAGARNREGENSGGGRGDQSARGNRRVLLTGASCH